MAAPFLLLIVVVCSCKRPQSFDYRGVKNLQVKHIGFNKSVITMDLYFYNPNNIGFNLKKIDCDVSLNHNFLGKYLLDTSLHISKKSVFVVPASVTFNMVEFMQKTMSVLLNKEALIGVKGTSRVSKFGFNKNIPVQYETMYKLPL